MSDLSAKNTGNTPNLSGKETPDQLGQGSAMQGGHTAAPPGNAAAATLPKTQNAGLVSDMDNSTDNSGITNTPSIQTP